MADKHLYPRIEEGDEEEDESVVEDLPTSWSLSGRQGGLNHEEASQESDNSESGRAIFSELVGAIQQGASSSRQTISSDSDAVGESSSALSRLDSQVTASTVSSGGRRSTLKTVHSGRSLSSSESQQQQNETAEKDDASSGAFGLLRRLRHSPGSRPPGVSPRTTLLASKLSRRATAMRSRFSGGIGGNQSGGLEAVHSPPSPLHRRYKPGDKVLVLNQQSRWANLVNRHGFPPGEGHTPEEQRGPYMYVLATVKEVHFEEFTPSYTVVRADTGSDQRADADFMEPLRTANGEAAAMNAATQSSAAAQGEDEMGRNRSRESDAFENPNKWMARLQQICYLLLLPFMWLFECCSSVCTRSFLPLWRRCSVFMKGRARLFLHGSDPFVCRVRVTTVNFVVICSIWYMFMDQIRLAFIPPRADNALAYVNFAVWLVLVIELLFQVFIRPNGYRNLIISDKAYSPTTVQYISAFHLIFETISLGIFVPEFLCIFSTYHCSDRIPFSFYNAALIGVIGPKRRDVFYGRAYTALIRLRVFGLVRHWRNMWIMNTFISMKSKNQSGFLATIVPTRGSRVGSERRSLHEKGNLDPDDHTKNDATLTNASTIGTALMVTNSYRALGIMWAIFGLMPILFAISTETVNAVALRMTDQLQATNLLAADTTNETCAFLASSVRAWLTGVTSSNYIEDNPYALSLDLQPTRCTNFLGVGELLSNQSCEVLKKQLDARIDRLTRLGEEIPDSLARESRRFESLCRWWILPPDSTEDEIADEFAELLDLRTGSILIYRRMDIGNLTVVTDGGNVTNVANYSVITSFDETETVSTA